MGTNWEAGAYDRLHSVVLTNAKRCMRSVEYVNNGIDMSFLDQHCTSQGWSCHDIPIKKSSVYFRFAFVNDRYKHDKQPYIQHNLSSITPIAKQPKSLTTKATEFQANTRLQLNRHILHLRLLFVSKEPQNRNGCRQHTLFSRRHGKQTSRKADIIRKCHVDIDRRHWRWVCVLLSRTWCFSCT